MVWILFALVAVFVVVVLVAVVTGRLTPDPMAEPVGSTPHHGLPEGAWAADDIDLSDFSGWGDAERIAVNVETVYRELDPARPDPSRPELFVRMARWASRH